MFMKPGYPTASPLLLNQTLVRNPLIPTPFHPGQFNPMVLSQLPGYLPATAQTLPPHAIHASTAGTLPPPAFSSPLIAQHPLSFPMVPLLNSPYSHPSMAPHQTSNGLLLSTGLPTVNGHQLTGNQLNGAQLNGAQLSAGHHSASMSSPYSVAHHNSTPSTLHHPPTSSHPGQSNHHYPSATNGVSSMSSQPQSYPTRQSILPTAINSAAVPSMPTMYNRTDGLLPHHQGHPLLWTPNSVWW